MAVPVVRAIDEDTAHAHLAHLSEGDLLTPHAAIEAVRRRGSNYQSLGLGKARKLPRVVGVEN
jgi:hypothetical protein